MEVDLNSIRFETLDPLHEYPDYVCVMHVRGGLMCGKRNPLQFRSHQGTPPT